ncbi:hypothetical protein [Mucilaginibacter celer]|uniref:hypothetical protein n=1 Tax=Mucilaginibacter celer TaxID=2305508 RepID=UPI0013CEA92E|nr:hypothetical protein [Mucilaginibacter celer]
MIKRALNEGIFIVTTIKTVKDALITTIGNLWEMFFYGMTAKAIGELEGSVFMIAADGA